MHSEVALDAFSCLFFLTALCGMDGWKLMMLGLSWCWREGEVVYE